MATYKVPQDVEAEDKLIGFLSLKQFIFVLIMCAALWMCWILVQVNIFLGLIPLPIVIVSGMLGLYQRKDQPVEVYLASWLRFKLKPRTRRWDQEGLEQRVVVTAPKIIEKNYTKGLTEQQVASRLTQLSSLLDSRGWASKQVSGAPQAIDNQRLLSMQELSRYSRPDIPLDADRASVVDAYDTSDPRNRTSQEVERDFTNVSKQQHENALAVVEQARKEAAKATPKPRAEAAAPIAPVQKQTAPTPKAPQAVAPIAPTKPVVKPITQKPLEKTGESVSESADGEVTIELHHKK